MALSPERRIADQEKALRIMAEDLGDTPLFDREWPKSDPRFADLASTTWVELQEKGLVARSRIQNEVRYLLTEAGWISGLTLNGTLDDPVFRARCVALVQFLKHLVDGRDGEIAARLHHEKWPAEFPFGWMLNILNSALLQRMFPDKRMNAYWERGTASVRVPVTFGMPVD